MKEIFKVTKKYFKSPFLYIFAFVFTTLQGLAELILPKMMGDIVNRGIIRGDLQFIYSVGIKMLVVTGVLGLSGYFAFIFCNIAVLRFGNELRVKLFGHVVSLKYGKLQSIGGGSVITRLTGDVEKVASVIKITIDLIYKPLLLAVGGFLMIFSINSKFGLIFLSFIVIQIIIIALFVKKSAPLFMQVQHRIDNINTRLQQVLHSMRLIKESITENEEQRIFRDKNKSLFTKNIEVLSIMCLLNPVIMFIMNITIVVIVVMIGYYGVDQSSSIGNVMMSITYSEQILMSIMISSNLARTISEIKPSLERLGEIEMLSEEAVSKRNTAGERKDVGNVETVVLRHVSKSFNEGKPVLKDISLELSSGMSIAIQGSTSCGKTTLSEIIAGLEDFDEGELLINGNDIRTISQESLRSKITVVGAYNAAIYSGNYMDNIILGRDISEEDAKKAAACAQISEFIMSTDYGYDSIVYASGNTISGGQRQRLMIARALSGNPDVLILDDSTSSLDYATEKKVIENIRENYKNMILILITERSGSVLSCDRAFKLVEGGLVS